jgi:hypothetical protein
MAIFLATAQQTVFLRRMDYKDFRKSAALYSGNIIGSTLATGSTFTDPTLQKSNAVYTNIFIIRIGVISRLHHSLSFNQRQFLFCRHTHTHTNTHIYIYIYIHTYSHAHTCAVHMPTCGCPYIHIHTNKKIHIHTYIHT